MIPELLKESLGNFGKVFVSFDRNSSEPFDMRHWIAGEPLLRKMEKEGILDIRARRQGSVVANSYTSLRLVTIQYTIVKSYLLHYLHKNNMAYILTMYVTVIHKNAQKYRNSTT